MADDWSDRDSPKSPSSGSRKKSGRVPTWLRIVSPISNLASLRKGGKVRKTGPANLHGGERVIPKDKVKRVEKMMRKKHMTLTDRGKKKTRGKTRGR